MINPWTGNKEKFVGGRIENWKRTYDERIIGTIYDDPRGDLGGSKDFRDGNYIITSTLVSIDEDKGVLETSNTIYTLGKKYGSSICDE
jgi:hypothetical protein